MQHLKALQRLLEFAKFARQNRTFYLFLRDYLKQKVVEYFQGRKAEWARISYVFLDTLYDRWTK